jgi:uncharacterized membrane protein
MDWSAVGGLIADAFRSLENLISSLLADTIFKAKPELAARFGGPISLLVSLTALYVILTFISAARKAIALILAIGWIALIAAMALSLPPLSSLSP